MCKSKTVEFKVHTPNLLKEILNNPGTGILSKPLNILGRILYEVGQEASRINDPRLNALMMRLTIYAEADPECKEYNPKLVKEVTDLAEKIKANEQPR